jgi:predicted small lipoprotein YifL
MNGEQEKNPLQDSSQGGPPPPPQPEIKMRSLESDVKSVEETGGGMPEPEIIKPSEIDDTGGPITPPETTSPNEYSSPGVVEMEAKGGARRWLVWLLVIVLIIGVALLGYKYAGPLLFPEETAVEESDTDTTVEEPIVPAITHVSAFGNSADNISPLSVSDYNLIAILTTLQNEGSNVLANNEGEGLKEVTFSIGGNPANSHDLLTTLLPELKDSDAGNMLKNSFEKDFTSFLYYNTSKLGYGTWPGYIVRLRSPETADYDYVSMKKILEEIEGASIKNVFLTPPATDPSDFKTGPVGDNNTSRYSSFGSGTIASFNYGLIDDYLIISTTYKGFLQAVNAMSN